MRDDVDRFDVGCDIFTDSPVASRCRAYQPAATGVNVVDGGAPTCWVGESGVRSAGNASSSSLSWRIMASNSPSETVGASST